MKEQKMKRQSVIGNMIFYMFYGALKALIINAIGCFACVGFTCFSCTYPLAELIFRIMTWFDSSSDWDGSLDMELTGYTIILSILVFAALGAIQGFLGATSGNRRAKHTNKLIDAKDVLKEYQKQFNDMRDSENSVKYYESTKMTDVRSRKQSMDSMIAENEGKLKDMQGLLEKYK